MKGNSTKAKTCRDDLFKALEIDITMDDEKIHRPCTGDSYQLKLKLWKVKKNSHKDDKITVNIAEWTSHDHDKPCYNM